MLLSDGTDDYPYGPGGTPVEQASIGSGDQEYLVSDGQGSTRALLGPSGTVDATFTYDAYGNLTASSGATTTPLLYDGQDLDQTTGSYYLRARWYDPATAELTSVDPYVSETAEPYVYAGDDPVNEGDPTGDDATAEGCQPSGTVSLASDFLPDNAPGGPYHHLLLTSAKPAASYTSWVGTFAVQYAYVSYNGYPPNSLQFSFRLSAEVITGFRNMPVDADFQVWVNTVGIKFHYGHPNPDPPNYLFHSSLTDFRYEGKGQEYRPMPKDTVQIEFTASNSVGFVGSQAWIAIGS
jgi:RHS repeat-associated protein